MTRERSSFGLDVSLIANTAGLAEDKRRTNVETGIHQVDESVDIVSLGTDSTNDGGLSRQPLIPLSSPHQVGTHAYLSQEFLLIGEIVETRSERAQPSELRLRGGGHVDM